MACEIAITAKVTPTSAAYICILKGKKQKFNAWDILEGKFYFRFFFFFFFCSLIYSGAPACGTL